MPGWQMLALLVLLLAVWLAFRSRPEPLSLACGAAAFVYAFPTVEMNRYLDLAPNVFHHDTEAALVSPNEDTLYSRALVNVSRGPVHLVVPEAHGRYCLLQFVDLRTNNFRYIGPHEPGSYTLTEADRSVYLVLARIHVDGDPAGARELQRRFTLQGPITPRMPPFVDGKRQICTEEQARAFVLSHDDLVTFCQHREATSEALVRLAGAAGLERGRRAVLAALDGPSRGWQSSEAYFAAPSYLTRAVVAWQYIFANSPSKAVYYVCRGDAKGLRLRGDRTYRLAFEPPEVTGFWSLAVYGQDGRPPATKPRRLDARSLDAMPLWLSPHPPERGAWLLPPPGRFYLLLRAYGLAAPYEPAEVVEAR